MFCTQLTDNDFQKLFVKVTSVLGPPHWEPVSKEHATIDDALAWYLDDLIAKMDNAVGISFAAGVVEESSHLHAHTVFWTAQKITFDYAKRIIPVAHYEDCQRRLTSNIDYLYKRNGHEDKGHTNRSSVIERGELPLTTDTYSNFEWVNFVKAGHDFRQLVEMYPGVVSRGSFGMKAYLEVLEVYRNQKPWIEKLRVMDDKVYDNLVKAIKQFELEKEKQNDSEDSGGIS